MNPKTLLKKRGDMLRRVRSRLHEGAGDIAQVVLLDGAAIPGRKLNFIFENTLPPGASIGEHEHRGVDEEYYHVLSGSGTMTLDGKAYGVGSGDITAAFQGGRHELRNTGAEDLRVLVISVA